MNKVVARFKMDCLVKTPPAKCVVLKEGMPLIEQEIQAEVLRRQKVSDTEASDSRKRKLQKVEEDIVRRRQRLMVAVTQYAKSVRKHETI